ncbi:SET domain-containing protein [Coniophora puteana RWD-64-598 SS2]|uniref:SET domain-containing protein n=1 Tax=Coniophora puteana (strain RWD-64-598) TaxID=741705 RepID=A0A5M3MQG9_CONPW|nr:SET domain-containing protein [Coniophora puteana RWD-64-598 SS2]EIW81423.1 SET domain-containing protein [Coniophora puteana RWD-64-598 SS2]
MEPELSSLQGVRLEPHPTARNKAVTSRSFSPGDCILTVRAFATALIPSFKGKRCDRCLRLESSGIDLKRCSGCASYYYCGPQCQTSQWSAHRSYCKNIQRFQASAEYQKMETHERMDSMLLTHLLAELRSNHTAECTQQLSTFLSLLPRPDIANPPPICAMNGRAGTIPDVNDLFSRFSNNNFAVHSHLTTVAHGVFPLASRLFNHSCLPNAAARYILSEDAAPRMEIVALQDIGAGEEICVPYLDPALLQSRQQGFQLTYGFTCTCPSCSVLDSIGRVPPPPSSREDQESLARALRTHAFPTSPTSTSPDFVLPAGPRTPPDVLLAALNESYLTSLSESFSAASHDGPYSDALNVGMTLLALYCTIYPQNYPQIGVHLLEMAKTAWNAFVTADQNVADGATRTENAGLVDRAQLYLGLSRQVLNVFGREGDDGGPLDEIETLQGLLSNV